MSVRHPSRKVTKNSCIDMQQVGVPVYWAFSFLCWEIIHRTQEVDASIPCNAWLHCQLYALPYVYVQH